MDQTMNGGFELNDCKSEANNCESKSEVNNCESKSEVNACESEVNDCESKYEINDSNGSESDCESNEDIDENTIKYYTLIDPITGKGSGRFCGYTPRQAAAKAFTKMILISKKNNENVSENKIVTIKEVTENSSIEIYKYDASRVKIDPPLELSIKDPTTGDDKKIIYHYRNKIAKKIE